MLSLRCEQGDIKRHQHINVKAMELNKTILGRTK